MTCYNLEYRVGSQMRFRHVSFNDDVSEEEAIQDFHSRMRGRSLFCLYISSSFFEPEDIPMLPLFYSIAFYVLCHLYIIPPFSLNTSPAPSHGESDFL